MINKDKNDVWKEKARALVAKMTLEEKTSQLSYRSPAIERLGIPAYNWWNEALHGVARAGTATSFPQVIGMAASFDEDLIHQVADAIATEGRAKYNESVQKGDRDIYKGLTFWCPNINIVRDPRWGRGHETFGEDPYLTSRLGVAYVKGLQGDGVHLKAAACVKHFAAHSGPEEGRHSFDSIVSPKDLWETYLPAFEACVCEAKAEGVMGAYNRLNGEACCASKTLLRDILRNTWGFDGYVVSDCGAIADIHMYHGITDTAEESAALALQSGCDLNCGNIYLYLQKAVMDGLAEESDVDEAVCHLLTTRMRLGMFEPCEYDDIPFEMVECKEHIALSEEAARRSVVLLKNNGILPLDGRQLKTVGVIGPNADSREALRANYYGTSSQSITLLEGIRNELSEDTRILYAEGSHLYKDTINGGALKHDRLQEAVSVAERSDVVVLCLGLDAGIEGEEGDANNEYAAGDKRTLALPAAQQALMEAVAAAGTPVILCVLAGSALDLRFAHDHLDAVLTAWYPGARGGKAVADILFGKAAPSGKLPVTFYESTDQLPAFEDYSMKGRTYRYLKQEPLYPFGYGLNYGDTFCISAECRMDMDGTVHVDAVVANEGMREARDVLQIYVKNRELVLDVPNYSLCKAAPFSLDAGEVKTLHLVIDQRALDVVDEDGCRRRGDGPYAFYVGCSQPDARSMTLTGRALVMAELERLVVE